MAANNGGGRQGNNAMNEHVEFSVSFDECCERTYDGWYGWKCCASEVWSNSARSNDAHLIF